MHGTSSAAGNVTLTTPTPLGFGGERIDFLAFNIFSSLLLLLLLYFSRSPECKNIYIHMIR